MQNDKLIKLYIGCGTQIKEGYYNIDQYVYASGVIQMDIFNLSFESDSVDEIFTEHMLEHIGKYEVPLALKEWARVLKPDGKLVMNLPNIEWCMQQWLAKPEDERWGWQLDTIFGLQTHPGEFHKTGFTAPRLQQLLKVAGFQNINISNYWSHAQSCFWVEASKGYCTSAVNCGNKISNTYPIPKSYLLIMVANQKEKQHWKNFAVGRILSCCEMRQIEALLRRTIRE
jgi:predicted SAM-dependent methyltransferase